MLQQEEGEGRAEAPKWRVGEKILIFFSPEWRGEVMKISRIEEAGL